MIKRKIEITEETGIKLGRIAYEHGDIVSIDKELADMAIQQGWAKCVETGEQGERKPGATKLTVDSLIHKIGQL